MKPKHLQCPRIDVTSHSHDLLFSSHICSRLCQNLCLALVVVEHDHLLLKCLSGHARKLKKYAEVTSRTLDRNSIFVYWIWFVLKAGIYRCSWVTCFTLPRKQPLLTAITEKAYAIVYPRAMVPSFRVRTSVIRSSRFLRGMFRAVAYTTPSSFAVNDSRHKYPSKENLNEQARTRVAFAR